MAVRALADLLEILGNAGEVVRVEAEVDPLLEVAEITSRVAVAGGPALLFTAVRGHDMPLLANLLGIEAFFMHQAADRAYHRRGIDPTAQA